MALELFSNFGTTTLNGAITNSATSITVTDASVLPSSGNFRVKIEDELLLVTAVSGNNLTVTRGVESTSAVSHLTLTTVTGMLLTAQSLANFRSDTIKYDTTGNRDGINKAGRLYMPSDGNGVLAYNDGTNWNSFGGRLFTGLTTPVASNFATVLNGTHGTFINNGDVAVLASGSASDSNGSGYFKSAPTEPYTITAQFQTLYFAGGSGSVFSGLALRQTTAGTSQIILFGWSRSTSIGFVVAKAAYDGTVITLSNTVALFNVAVSFWMERPTWFQIFQPAVGNRTYSVSIDGQNWVQVYSESRTNYITPDQVGFIIGNDLASATEAYSLVSSYKET